MNPHCDGTTGLCNSPEHWTHTTFQDGPDIDPVLDFDFNEALSGMEFTFPGCYDVGDITAPSVTGFAIDMAAFAALPFEPRPGPMEMLPSAINAQDIDSQQDFIWNPSSASSQASMPRFVPRPSRSTLCSAADNRTRSSLFDYSRATPPTRASTGHTTTSKRPASCIDTSYMTASVPAGELQFSWNGHVNDVPGLALLAEPTSAVSRSMLPPLVYGTSSNINTEDLAADTTERPRKRQKGHLRAFECEECKDCFKRPCDLTKHIKYKHLPGEHVCLQCNRGFHWPKDLKRHELVCLASTLPRSASMNYTVSDSAQDASSNPSSNVRLMRVPSVLIKEPSLDILERCLQQYHTAFSNLARHLEASAVELSSKGVVPKVPGMLVTMKLIMHQIEQQTLRDHGRSATNSSRVWNIKGADVAVLAAVVGLRWVRKSNVGLRGQGLNSRHSAWSAMPEGIGRVFDEL
ncbi:hypothetical protein LTR95_003580 [Oleoguttula sp. CCFEE 5521]